MDQLAAAVTSRLATAALAAAALATVLTARTAHAEEGCHQQSL